MNEAQNKRSYLVDDIRVDFEETKGGTLLSLNLAAQEALGHSDACDKLQHLFTQLGGDDLWRSRTGHNVTRPTAVNEDGGPPGEFDEYIGKSKYWRMEVRIFSHRSEGTYGLITSQLESTARALASLLDFEPGDESPGAQVGSMDIQQGKERGRNF